MDTDVKKKSDNYFNKLVKDDNHFNVGNFFLVVVTILSAALLIVPLGLLVEMWFNHTIATDLNGMAAYIVSITSLLGVGGATWGWTEHSRNKFNNGNSDNLEK